MSSLSRTAQAKLAQEIQAAAPAPEWSAVGELKKWRATIEVKGKKQTMTFDQLIVRDRELDAEIEFRQKQKDLLKPEIQAAMLMADSEQSIKKVTCEGYSVSLVERKGSRKIIAERLLENGVSATVIAASTEIGPSSQYVQIRLAKES